MSPLDIVIDAFNEQYGEKAKELISALLGYIEQGWSLNKAVNQALLDVGLASWLDDNISSAVKESATIGLGEAIPLLKPLESAWDGSGMKLSEKLHGTSKKMREAITNTIQAQLALNSHANKISRELYDGYNSNKAIINRQALPKYISQLANFARRSDLTDSEKHELLKLCRKTQKQVDKLSANEAPTKAQKTAYNQLLRAVEKGSQHALHKAVSTAVEEKSRYVADRIARTESARAWQDGYLKKYEDNRRVVAHKWNVSSRHPVFDICDMYAKADLYGLGAGIFPKDKVPRIPVHPHCMCYLSPIYKSELKDKTETENIQNGGDEWLKKLPDKKKYKVLGIDGLKAWKNGADWRNYMRNYSAEPAKSRLNSLKPTAKDDIIISGALDPDSPKAEAFAFRYYASVRKMSTDCELIMKHIQSLKDNDIKIDIKMIKKAKKHLFMTKHKLFGSDEPVYFYPDYDIAQSWQRLTDKNRKLEAHDLLLIPHEALESDYMAKGYSQREAHNLANEKYDYEKTLKTKKEGKN